MELNANALLWMIGNLVSQIAALTDEVSALKAELASKEE